MSNAVLALRLCIAGVFLASAVAKLRAFDAATDVWADVLRRWGLRTKATPRYAAGLLIVVEAVAGVGLLIGGALAMPAFLLASALLVGFTLLALISALADIDVRCACFGRVTARLGWRHVWRNLFLLGMAVAALLGTVHLADEPIAVAGAAIAVATAVLVTMLAVFYDDLVDLFVESV